MVRYDEIVDALRTGDLILFHGELPSSELTEVLQGTIWSHVAMVVRPEDIDLDYDRVLLWESNTLKNLPDEALHKAKVGPMLVDLEERLITDKRGKYDNVFKIRYLNAGVFEEDKELIHKRLKEFIKKVHSGGYPESEFQMFKDYFAGKILHKDPEPDKYFCSELIADTLMNMKLLTSEYLPNTYKPKHFSERGHLSLINRAYLSEGPYIKVE